MLDYNKLNYEMGEEYEVNNGTPGSVVLAFISIILGAILVPPVCDWLFSHFLGF